MAMRDFSGRFVSSDVGVSVEFDDRGLKGFAQTIKDLGSMDLYIGVQGESGAAIYPNRNQEINVASVAYWQEFGTRALNSRSFLRRTVFDRRRDIEASLQRAAERAIDTGDALEALGGAGDEIGEMVRATILKSRTWAKPNAPSTIAKKKFDWPLVETGKLVEESISYTIRDKAGAVLKSGDPLSG